MNDWEDDLLGPGYLQMTIPLDPDEEGEVVTTLVTFFAKAVQPELFTDLDLQKVTEDFYKNYFGFDLSDEDLTHLFNLTDGQKVADVFAK